jgi:tetratricopeptide (TPR) repeat protein
MTGERNLVAVLALLAAAPVAAAVDVDTLWNFSNPAASEQLFRVALSTAQADDALVLRSQIARTYSLRGRYEEAHRELDAMQPALPSAGAEARVRALLERGRTWRSAGQAQQAQPLFQQAFELADHARLRALAGDALHMLALSASPLDERIQWNRRTADYAFASDDPKARYWAGPALNNLGTDLREAQRLPESLRAFEEALQAFKHMGRDRAVRVARWQVAHVLRLLGRSDEALAEQLALERDNDAVGAPDGFVYDELALLHDSRGDAARAQHYRALRAALGRKQP